MFASASSILSSAASVMWPLLVAAVFFFLLPELRKVLQSRDFAIEVFGMKLSAQAASDQLACRAVLSNWRPQARYLPMVRRSSRLL